MRGSSNLTLPKKSVKNTYFRNVIGLREVQFCSAGLVLKYPCLNICIFVGCVCVFMCEFVCVQNKTKNIDRIVKYLHYMYFSYACNRQLIEIKQKYVVGLS